MVWCNVTQPSKHVLIMSQCWECTGPIVSQLLTKSWHRHTFHIMMTSSNGKISALLAFCVGNSPGTGEFPAQRPVTWSFDVFFDLCLNNMNKRLSKDSWGWWFEMPSHPLWRHCNVIGPLWRESTGHSSGGLSLRRVSNTDLWCLLRCFPWC